MKTKKQYNKHKKRSHRSHRKSLIGMQISKSHRYMSRFEQALFNSRYGGY